MENKKYPESLRTKAEYNIKFQVQNRPEGMGYLSPYNKDSKMGIVMIQEWWGLNQNIANKADEYAKNGGFTVICPDVYRGKVAQDLEEAGHLMGSLDFDGAAQDIMAASEFLLKTCNKVGVIGFCMGGALAIVCLATSKTFSCGAPFYGIPDLTKIDLANIKVPVFLNFADLDDVKGFSDKESAEKLYANMKEKNCNVELKMYSNSKHAFNNIDCPNYNKETSKEADELTIKFFNKYLA